MENNKLIKLTEEHYVIVDDTEIKYKDWYLDDTNQVRMCVVLDTDYWKSRKEYKKITHSTRPLEKEYTSSEDGGKGYFVYDKIQELSLQEVKELIGDIPNPKLIDSMAMTYRHDFGLLKENEKEPIRTTMKQIWSKYRLFEEEIGLGFYKLDNKDKKYTEEDMRKCWRASQVFERPYSEGYAPNFEEFIQSLQPKTEWEVEWEVCETYKLDECNSRFACCDKPKKLKLK